MQGVRCRARERDRERETERERYQFDVPEQGAAVAVIDEEHSRRELPGLGFRVQGSGFRV